MKRINLLLCCYCAVLHCTLEVTYVNVAFQRPAWQKYPYHGEFGDANRAVDGMKTNLSYSGGQCVASNGYPTAEWRVDLGGVTSIRHIVIQYMTGDLPWDETNYHTEDFLGFSIYISNKTNKEKGVLCFRDTNFTRATIPNPVTIQCPYHGRYVIYYNNRTHPPYPAGYSTFAYNFLCELEVYGIHHGSKSYQKMYTEVMSE